MFQTACFPNSTYLKGFAVNIQINNITVSNDAPFTLFGGINVLEDLDSTLKACEQFSKPLSTRQTVLPSTLSAVWVWTKA